MLGKLFCLVLVVLLSFSADVTGQQIIWGAVNKSCSSDNVLLEGERIILNAVLNATSRYLPLNQIYLEQFSYTVYTWLNICQVNIIRDGCRGPRQDLCGYCDHQNRNEYHVAFKIIVNTNRTGSASYRIKWASPSLLPIYSTSFYLYTLLDNFYAITRMKYDVSYSVQDITKDVLLLRDSSAVMSTLFPTRGYVTWGYDNHPVYSSYLYGELVYYNLSLWDSHVGDVIQVNFTVNCQRNVSFTIPVTYRPVFVCELPILLRSKSTGTQIVTQCRFSSFSLARKLLPTISCSMSSYPYIPTSVNVTRGDDIFTCTINVNSSYFRPNQSAYIYVKWYPVMDVQFTNGTKQTPRVVLFQVNGSRSITVEPGEEVSFECKVYGNPTAVAVLVGTGLGRIQEERSDTDLLLTTLAKVQCEDSGRYTCKGVSGFGSTPEDGQAHVDVSVRCPPTIKSHRKFNFDPGSNILVALEVSGYPAPTHFSLQVEQNSTSSEVDKDQYSVSSVELNPSLAVLTLIIFSRDNGGPETYVFRISNGANSSLDFQFEAGKLEAGAGNGEESITSPWLYAFIAVMCVMIVLVIAGVVIIFVMKTRWQKKTSDESFSDTRIRTYNAYRGSKLQDPSYAMTSALPNCLQQPATADPAASDYDTVNEVENDRYESVIGNVYENAVQPDI